MLIPVILSGGAGTRLWPVSRETRPKPFMTLPDGESLLQHTLRRTLTLGPTRILTVTNREYFFSARDEYSSVEIPERTKLEYLLEPMGRNTAPAIAAAALCLREKCGEDPVLLVLPSDHLVSDTAAFARAVTTACALARDGFIVTFGIVPTHAETGFGYIQADASAGLEGGAYSVSRFVEKPSSGAAAEFLADGSYYWNSGMLCVRCGTFLEELARCSPELFSAVDKCWNETRREESVVELAATAFASVPSISADYAVLEKARKVAVVPAEFDWNDIGCWHSLANLTKPDAAGNRLDGDVISIDSRNCYIRSENRLVAAVGVQDLVVVDTPDALLVAERDSVQQVRDVVAALNKRGHETAQAHRTVHRPWGTYTVLEQGTGFKIKRIVVRPGASLSLQLHRHRSEHWIVVSGAAKIVNGANETVINPNESTYIGPGTPHRLTNPGAVDCVMIEVQCGDYVGEDDIIRFDDTYGRASK